MSLLLNSDFTLTRYSVPKDWPLPDLVLNLGLDGL